MSLGHEPLGRPRRSSHPEVEPATGGLALGVSQPYLAMLETGARRLTPALARRVMRTYGIEPTVLPPGPPGGTPVHADRLTRDLAVLDYPGLAYPHPKQSPPRHPAEVLLTALAQGDLEARLVEALP